MRDLHTATMWTELEWLSYAFGLRFYIPDTGCSFLHATATLLAAWVMAFITEKICSNSEHEWWGSVVFGWPKTAVVSSKESVCCRALFCYQIVSIVKQCLRIVQYFVYCTRLRYCKFGFYNEYSFFFVVVVWFQRNSVLWHSLQALKTFPSVFFCILYLWRKEY